MTFIRRRNPLQHLFLAPGIRSPLHVLLFLGVSTALCLFFFKDKIQGDPLSMDTIILAQKCQVGARPLNMLFHELGQQPEFDYLRPKWTTPSEFLDRCGALDGSEHLLTANTSLASPLLRPLAPLFHPGLSFQDAVAALDAFDKAKTSPRAQHTEHTCLPWDTRLAHYDPAVAGAGYTLRIAMFTTATRNSKDLFGRSYTQNDQAVYDRAYKLSLQDKTEYCNRHGYDLHVFDDVLEDRSVGWSRLPAALSLLDRYDWVFHIDLDTVIMDHGAKLEEFLDPRYDIVIGVDMNGINNGVFCLRNSAWSRMLYAEAWTRTDAPHSEIWYEQAALMAILAESHSVRNHIKLVPQEHFNTYLGPGDTLPANDPHPFILHFPGRGDKWAMVERFVHQRQKGPEK